MTMTATALTGLDGEQITLTNEDLGHLRSRAGGRVLRPGDDGWEQSVQLWNGLPVRHPALVVQPSTAVEVSAAVNFARDRGLRLSVKGGGHHIAGTAIADRGLVLDLSRMRDVRMDAAARLAHVGPGCLLRDVDAAAQVHGLATPLGFISEVGVAGLTLGGGLGYLTRRFGWTVDNLEAVQIVTADGAVRVASAEQNADLFWGVRGAGANLGVVTRFTLRLHEVGPLVFGGLIGWSFDRAAEILTAYRAITAAAPRELAVWMILLRAPAAPFVPPVWQGQRMCAMAVCYTGDLSLAEEAVAPVRALENPIFDLLHEQPYTQVQSYLDATEPKGNHYYWRTEYLSELSDDLLSTARDLFAECPIPEADLGFLHLAGAINERAADEGAVGNRDARYVIGVKGMWAPGEPRAEEFSEWVRRGGDRVRPHGTGSTYINFQTADEGDERVRATYGANYARLVEIKRAYDPGNLFRSNRNIGA